MIQVDRRAQALLLVLAAALLFGAGIKYARWTMQPAPPQVIAAGANDSPVREQTPVQQELAVHLSGAVQFPGVYRVPKGSRVIDGVEKAKPTEEADIQALNLAAPLIDGQKITVPKKGEPLVGGAPAGGVPAASQPGLININSATLEQLDSLPGIGPALAQRIIDYRNNKGPFRDIKDLTNVSGIGEAKYNQLKDLISVY
ncbi:MAG: helix-hairpin-helix domain-containing protein [Syntrophomonadaceae bacterium]|nr:helix-hairpin-helix domain-containing protein [Syntrophomonadaceae bacterium]